MIACGTIGGYLLNISINDSIIFNLPNIEAKYWTFYTVLFSCSLGIIFSRPKYELQRMVEVERDRSRELNYQLEAQIEHKLKSIDKLRNIRFEILRNIEHEVRTPMMNVTSSIELLHKLWPTIKGDEERLGKLIDMVYQGGARLEKYVGN
jgi:signal transduction histidine kinase